MAKHHRIVDDLRRHARSSGSRSRAPERRASAGIPATVPVTSWPSCWWSACEMLRTREAVVTSYHVGGILIGSDTDLTILTARWPGSLPAGVRCRWR